MFILFGSGRKTKRTQFIGYRYFPQARAFEHHFLAINYSYFSIFFIPLLKFNKKRYLVVGDEFSYGKELSREDYDSLLQTYQGFISPEENHQLLKDIQATVQTLSDLELVPEVVLAQLDNYKHVLREYMVAQVDAFLQFEQYKRKENLDFNLF